MHSDTFSKWCVVKRGPVEECSVAPFCNKRVKTLCGCREKRVQTKEKYKLRLTTKAYNLSYNYLKLHHKSSWQIVGQVTSQAPVFWRLKGSEEGVVRVCSEASAVWEM
jgi:hypothetical protein